MAWKNIKDAGFPDRILWHRAVAARHTYYDTAKVGIYGGFGGDYGVRKRNDLFVKHLLDVEPPEWNQMEEIPVGTAPARDERRE